MKALVLEEKGKLSLRDFDIPGALGPKDVKIRTHTVGICGSDVHYLTHGRIGSFAVTSPMVLGHESAGVVEAVGGPWGLRVGRSDPGVRRAQGRPGAAPGG